MGNKIKQFSFKKFMKKILINLFDNIISNEILNKDNAEAILKVSRIYFLYNSWPHGLDPDSTQRLSLLLNLSLVQKCKHR